jgi:hypothetical protein
MLECSETAVSRQKTKGPGVSSIGQYMSECSETGEGSGRASNSASVSYKRVRVRTQSLGFFLISSADAYASIFLMLRTRDLPEHQSASRGRLRGKGGKISQAGRQADRQPGRQTARQAGRQTARQADRQPGRQTDSPAGRLAARQAGWQAGRQAGQMCEPRTLLSPLYA